MDYEYMQSWHTHRCDLSSHVEHKPMGNQTAAGGQISHMGKPQACEWGVRWISSEGVAGGRLKVPLQVGYAYGPITPSTRILDLSWFSWSLLFVKKTKNCTAGQQIS